MKLCTCIFIIASIICLTQEDEIDYSYNYTIANQTCQDKKQTPKSNCDSGSNKKSGIICCTEYLFNSPYSCKSKQTKLSLMDMVLFNSNPSWNNTQNYKCWDHYPSQNQIDVIINCSNTIKPIDASICNSISTTDDLCCFSSGLYKNNTNLTNTCFAMYPNLTKYLLNNNFLSNQTAIMNFQCKLKSGFYTLPTNISYYGNSWNFPIKLMWITIMLTLFILI